MTELRVGTAVTADYAGRARAWLASSARLTGCARFVVTVGWEWPAGERAAGVAFLPAAREDVAAACEPAFVNLQHGAFLPALAPAPADVVLLTDADAVWQRDLSAGEHAALLSLPEGAVAWGWNAGPEDTCRAEHERLGPQADADTAGRALGVNLATVAVYNTGLMALRPATWARLGDEFLRVWPAGHNLYRKPQAQQLLLCVAAHRLGLAVRPLGYETHSHRHYPLTADHSLRLCYRGGPVLFAHAAGAVVEAAP